MMPALNVEALTSTAPTLDLHVLDGVELKGNVNVSDEGILANIRHSIRLGFPQVQPYPIKPERVLLVGSGPSLAETEGELVDLYYAGAKIFTLNGGYHWCLQRNLRPSAQIVVDARPGNGRFLLPLVPQCRYLVASQCDPSTWAIANDGRENVWIWHAADPEGMFKTMLDDYYFGHWHGIAGGTTVAMRGLALLRTLGYVRFDVFGVDSCWKADQHHAIAQPENAGDVRIPFMAYPTGHPEMRRLFYCSPWMCKQLEDFLQLIRLAGDQFLLNVHGDGLLAFAIETAAELEGRVEDLCLTSAQSPSPSPP